MSRWVNAIATLIEGCADAMREAAGAHSEFEYKQIKQELFDVKAQLIEANAERDELYDELDFVRKEHAAHKAYVEKQSERLRAALEPLRNEGEAHDTKTLLGRISGVVAERDAAVNEAAHNRMMALSYQDADHAARARVRELQSELEWLKATAKRVEVAS